MEKSIISKLMEVLKPIDESTLQDLEGCENMRNAVGIMRLLAKGEEDVRWGRTKSQDEVFANIESVLRNEQMKISGLGLQFDRRFPVAPLRGNYFPLSLEGRGLGRG